MRWFKIAAIGVGILIAFLIAGSVIGFIIGAVTKLVIAALVVGAVAVAIKVARSRRQVSGSKAEREVRDRDHEEYNRPLPRADVEPAAPPPSPVRPATHDVDDELARLKREMGSLSLTSSPRRAWSRPSGFRPCAPAPRSGAPSPTW